MKIRHLVWSLLALLLIFTMILPSIFYRQDQEFTHRYYVAAVNVSQFAEKLSAPELAQFLKDYKAAGATVAVIEERNGAYDPAHLQMTLEAGLQLAPEPDVYNDSTAGLDALISQYGVQFIKLNKDPQNPAEGSLAKAEAVSGLIRQNKLTLVLTETIEQLGNYQPAGYEQYLEAAEGRILRCFRNGKLTYSDNGEYPYIYYQYLNSALDRNTRFLMAVPLIDETFDDQKNAQRCLESMELFCKKMDAEGFHQGAGPDLSAYVPKRAMPTAAVAALVVLMLATMIDLLSDKDLRWLLPASIPAAAAAMVLTFHLPEQLQLLYPTAFAAFSPCFCFTVVHRYLRKNCKRYTFMQLLLSTGLFGISLLTLSGSCVAAMMNGWDYWINELTFRGVKLTLLLPILFALFLLIRDEWRWLKPSAWKRTFGYLRRRIRWYHLLLLAVIGVVAGLYMLRSGNVKTISFFEAQMRNGLTEALLARPRTKEYLIGWPCLILLVYEMYRKGSSRFYQWIFALGSSVLFASTVNTFCHVFTPVETMYYRVVYGLIAGVTIGGVLVLLYSLFRHLTEKHHEV